MYTLKEMELILKLSDRYEKGYYDGYKDTIEDIFNYIVNMNAIGELKSIKEIEKYLQDLLIK